MGAIFYKDKVYGAGGSGGGSTVTITPTLSSGTKIADFEIDGTPGELYAPQGGGGGAGYTETTLFTGTYRTTSGEITLTDDLDKYDLVIFWTRWSNTSTNSEVPFFANVKYFVDTFVYNNGSTAVTSPHMGLTTFDTQYIRVKMGSAKNKLFLFDSHSIALAKVIGIKFGVRG